jgi:hypothetical protein
MICALILMSCDGSPTDGRKDLAPGGPEDMTATEPDCGSIIECPCRDGTCERIAGCGGMTCTTACNEHGGSNGFFCQDQDGGNR